MNLEHGLTRFWMMTAMHLNLLFWMNRNWAESIHSSFLWLSNLLWLELYFSTACFKKSVRGEHILIKINMCNQNGTLNKLTTYYVVQLMILLWSSLPIPRLFSKKEIMVIHLKDFSMGLLWFSYHLPVLPGSCIYAFMALTQWTQWTQWNMNMNMEYGPTGFWMMTTMPLSLLALTQWTW